MLTRLLQSRKTENAFDRCPKASYIIERGAETSLNSSCSYCTCAATVPGWRLFYLHAAIKVTRIASRRSGARMHTFAQTTHCAEPHLFRSAACALFPANPDWIIMPLIPEKKRKNNPCRSGTVCISMCRGAKGDVSISWIHPDAHKPTKTQVLQDERQEDSVKRFIQDSLCAASGSVWQRDERGEKRTWERDAPYIIFILNLRAAIHEEKDARRRGVISSRCIDSGRTSAVLSAPREKWCISISGRMTVTCHRRTNKAVCVCVCVYPRYRKRMAMMSFLKLKKKCKKKNLYFVLHSPVCAKLWYYSFPIKISGTLKWWSC